jgi:hypothetical protein
MFVQVCRTLWARDTARILPTHQEVLTHRIIYMLHCYTPLNAAHQVPLRKAKEQHRMSLCYILVAAAVAVPCL